MKKEFKTILVGKYFSMPYNGFMTRFKKLESRVRHPQTLPTNAEATFADGSTVQIFVRKDELVTVE